MNVNFADRKRFIEKYSFVFVGLSPTLALNKLLLSAGS